MKTTRIAAYILAAVALVLSACAYYEYVHLLGFPDGHVSALGDAQRKLAYAFIAISAIASTVFIYLAFTAQVAQRRVHLAAVFGAYALFAMCAFCFDRFYLIAALKEIG